MNKKLILWAGVLALALNVTAQEGPEDVEEMEMSEGPGMRPGMGGPGMGGPGMQGEKRVKITKKMMRGGPGMGEERGGMRGPGFINEEESLAIIKKNDPAFGKKVEDMKTAAPAKYKVVMMLSGRMLAMGRLENDESLERDAVRGLALEFETKELGMKYDKASETEKKAIKESLKAKLGELFDLKTKGQELRVKRMEKEIGKLNKNLESRKANKAKIVEQRLEQLTGEGVGW